MYNNISEIGQWDDNLIFPDFMFQNLYFWEKKLEILFLDKAIKSISQGLWGIRQWKFGLMIIKLSQSGQNIG